MLLNNVIFAFLLGSIPTGYLLAKFCGHGDIRKFGSGNIGATNVLRKSGKSIALVTLFIDFLKGFITCAGPIIAIDLFDLKSDFEYMLVGSAVILGHIFTPWLKFKGGKGVATALGVIFAISGMWGQTWLIIFILFIWFFIFIFTQYVALASVLSLFFAVVYSFFFLDNFFIFFAITAVLIAYKHKDNFERIKNNNEHKIRFY